MPVIGVVFRLNIEVFLDASNHVRYRVRYMRQDDATQAGMVEDDSLQHCLDQLKSILQAMP